MPYAFTTCSMPDRLQQRFCQHTMLHAPPQLHMPASSFWKSNRRPICRPYRLMALQPSFPQVSVQEVMGERTSTLALDSCLIFCSCLPPTPSSRPCRHTSPAQNATYGHTQHAQHYQRVHRTTACMPQQGYCQQVGAVSMHGLYMLCVYPAYGSAAVMCCQ